MGREYVRVDEDAEHARSLAPYLEAFQSERTHRVVDGIYVKRVIEDLHTQLGMITVSLGLAVGTYFADIWVAAGLFALLGAFLYWRLSKKLMGIGDHFGTSQLQASRITVMEERVASSRYCPDCGCVSCFATMEYVCREDLTSLLAPHTRAGNPEWELPARDFWRRQANDVKK